MYKASPSKNFRETVLVRHAIPEGIGPHEGRELELMLSGEKPLAMFSDVIASGFEWPDAEFQPHVSSGRLIKKEFLAQTPDGRHTLRTVFCLAAGGLAY